MRLNGMGKEKHYPIILGILFALISTNTSAGTMGPVQVSTPGTVYFSVFGGWGSSNNVDINQYGVAFFPEASGGPLSVNAFGQTNSRDVGVIGGHVGYQWTNIFLNSLSDQFSISPSVELEGYYLGDSSFTGHDINNDTSRLPEHDFLVTYPLSTGVFLFNSVLNFNPAHYNRWHPYVGGGIGAAVLSISDAYSLQVAPLEVNVNHYNGNTGDKVAAFTGQAKLGLNFDLSTHTSLFAEYRWLYIANSKFAFGSTIYPLHVPTSSWAVNLGHQNYNIAAAGIRFRV